MLKVTIEIIPFGTKDKNKHRKLGSLDIVLIEKYHGRGDYISTMTTDGVYIPNNPQVNVVGYKREHGAFELVKLCLEAHLSTKKRSTKKRSTKVKKAEKVSAILLDKERPFACAGCGKTTDLILVEYSRDDPNYYDGISELQCTCGKRTGRWSGRVLEKGESEQPYGWTS